MQIQSYVLLTAAVLSFGLFSFYILPKIEVSDSKSFSWLNYDAQKYNDKNSDVTINDNGIPDGEIKYVFELLVRQTKICLLEQMTISLSTHDWIFKAVNVCSAAYNKALPLTPLVGEEVKHIVLPADRKSTECTVVSLGVGNNIGVEENLKTLWPACKFYGADPIYNSGIIFEKVGKYFQIAVGGKDGNFSASVLDGGYRRETVMHMNFLKFLNQAKITGLIDYLFLDAEGAEYEIMPIMETMSFNNRRNLEKSPIICQFNTELHLPLHGYNTNPEKFNKMIENFLKNTTFLPLTAGPYGGHIRMAWIDFGVPVCVEKYLPTFWKDYIDFINLPFRAL